MGIAVSESAYKDVSFAGGDAKPRNKEVKSLHHLPELNAGLKILFLDLVPRNPNMEWGSWVIVDQHSRSFSILT